MTSQSGAVSASFKVHVLAHCLSRHYRKLAEAGVVRYGFVKVPSSTTRPTTSASLPTPAELQAIFSQQTTPTNLNRKATTTKY
jgi:hypothetical protein